MKKIVICRDRYDKEHEVPTGLLWFRPSVYGLLIEDGKVLLSPQWDGYDFPGGGVNIDEGLEEALVREFKEETGLDVRTAQVVYASTSFYYLSLRKNESEPHWNCPVIYFLVEKVGGELSLDYAEEYEKEFMKLPVWQPIDKLDGLLFHNSVGSRSPEIARLAQELKKYDL